MQSDLIIRVSYEGTIYDLDVLNEVPLRVDMSTVEVGDIGRLFGIGSQQFTLPGTKKNNRFFKNAYDIAADNPPGMYNSINGWVLQNGETLLYGQFQLMEIVTDEDGFVNYNVQISDRVIQFNEEIKGKFLKDGNWAEYSHSLSSGSIVDSWSDNLLGGAIFYPLGEYGRDDDNQDDSVYPYLGYHNNDIGTSLIPVKARQFLPAVKLKNVVDVIFDQVGFSYTGSFMETDDFNNLYMLTKPNDGFGPNVPSSSATFQAYEYSTQTVPLGGTRYVTASVESFDPQNAYNNSTYQYTAQASGEHTLQASYTFVNNSFESPGPDGMNAGKVTLQLRAGDVGSYTVVTTEEVFYDTYDPTFITVTAAGSQNMTGGVDKFFAVVTYEQVSGPGTLGTLTSTQASMACTSAPTTFEGAEVNMAEQFNPELKSEDIIKALITQFNLVMIPDPYNPSVLQIETFDYWMRQGEFKDWNDKYDTSQRVAITHTINELPKSIILSNTEDNDRFSVIAKEQEPYRQYGSLELIAESNNAIGDDTLETVFAPVILGSAFQTGSNYPNLNLSTTTVFPHLYKYDNDKVKSYAFKPRIGYKVNNTLPSGSSILLGLQGNLIEVSGSYGTLSNLSQLPGVAGSTNDLHFNNTYQDFGPSALNLDSGVTAFERYWETYYNSLYWDDAKKITLSAKFNPQEYKNIKLNDKVLIKNQYYRINKIKGFNVTARDVVEVELIRLYPSYFQLGGISGLGESVQGGASEGGATITPTPTVEGSTATPTPTVDPATATPTPTVEGPTPTPTETPLPTYYRFENCTTTELVFQTLESEPTVNGRYTDGIDNFIYDGTSTTQPGTVVTNLSGPIGTGCFDATATPTPEPQTLKAKITQCGGSTVWYVEFTDLSSLPDGFAITSDHANLVGNCWEITDANYTGAIDFSTTTTGYYTSCASCSPNTATPTPTPSATPIPCTAQDLGDSTLNGQDACDQFDAANRTTRYMDDIFASATVIYRDANCGPTVGAAGWYSDGVEYRYWDGTTLSSPIPCGGGEV